MHSSWRVLQSVELRQTRQKNKRTTNVDEKNRTYVFDPAVPGTHENLLAVVELSETSKRRRERNQRRRDVESSRADEMLTPSTSKIAWRKRRVK